MWFLKLIITFFFAIDQLVYDFISTIYDLLIQISRTTILSQSEINGFYQKIYMLLAIFMLFKVGFSLITYVVNPDDFTDKSKGIGKFGQNVIISLCMLVLVPYAFSMAYELQSIILEDNILATIILSDPTSKNDENYINTAGDTMAFTIMSAFIQPNTSLIQLNDCLTIYDESGEPNPSCFGYKIDESGTVTPVNNKLQNMRYYVDNGENLTETMIINHVLGLKNKNFGLAYRLNLLKATANMEDGDEVFVFEYKYIFSTVVGVVVVILLLGFCLDVALRSIKLAFLQMIAPIPIISFIDPKSGKDGIFKKWYKMCFSTFLSLFIRLASLYFGIYIISKVSGMTDIINGSQVTNPLVKIFIIIGVLMFVKQLPKMLEGLGLKIDGGGKFTLNPIKKMENEAFGGKALTGAAAGFAIGALGNKGNPFEASRGAFRGFFGGQGLSGAAKHQANVNKQLRQAKLDGSTFGGRMNARWQNATGAKGFNNVEKDRKEIETLKELSSAGAAIEDRAIEKIKNGEADELSNQYLAKQAEAQRLQEQFSKTGVAYYESKDSKGNIIQFQGAEAVARSQMDTNDYLNNTAKYQYIDEVIRGDRHDNAMKEQVKNYKARAADAKEDIKLDGKSIHNKVGEIKGRTSAMDRETRNRANSNQADQKYVEASRIKK